MKYNIDKKTLKNRNTKSYLTRLQNLEEITINTRVMVNVQQQMELAKKVRRPLSEYQVENLILQERTKEYNKLSAERQRIYKKYEIAGIRNYDEFLKRGTQVYVVMQSDPAVVREDLKDSPLPYHIICDQDQVIYRTLEIPATATKEERMPTSPEDIAKLEAKRQKVKEAGFVHGKYEGNEQQLPAMFVVDPDGSVVYAHYAKNSIDMPTVEEMLQILDELA